MSVTHRKPWLVWAGCTALVAIALFWGFTGSVPTKVRGEGILIEHGALFDVVSLGRGQIDEIFVEVGDTISQGQSLATLSMPKLEHEINAAQRLLENLIEQKERILDFGTRSTALRQSHLDARRLALLEAIDLLETQLADIIEREQALEKLMKSGTVSRQSYLDVKHRHHSLLESINQKRVELSKLPEEKVTDLSQKEKELLHIENKIISAEEQLSQLIDRHELEAQVTSPHAGRVQELFKRPGKMLDPGEPLLKVHLHVEQDDISVLAYLPPQLGKRAKAGMQAFVTPSTVQEEEYGHLLGTVAFIADFPASELGMLRELQNRKLVEALSQQGPPLMATILLRRDPQAPSGYAWSSGRGPAISIDNGTLCRVDIVVRRQSPASLVLPFLRKHLLGVGDSRAGQ